MTELTGKTLGAYQLIEEIAESGTSIVYKAFQPGLNRYLAVKVLKPSAGRGRETVDRFQRQAEIMAQFQSPFILQVFETGQEQGMYFRAMRLAENRSMAENRSWFFAPQNTLALFGEIVDGLEVIYNRGFIHGNIKSSNVLLDDKRHVLLTDFGLPYASQIGAISSHLAPEQIQGGVIDRRADVYALGVLLFEALIGEPPPAGSVVSAHARRADLPQAVDQVIFKAMAQNPDQRFQSPVELLNALNAALTVQAPRPVYTPPPPPSTISQSVTVESSGKQGSNTVAIILGVIVLIGLCIGAILLYQKFIRDQNVSAGTPTQPLVQPTQPNPAPTKPPAIIILPTQPPPVIILPTQPPPITQVLPTHAPPPTQPPIQPPSRPPVQPILPPQQPTQPAPAIAQPIATPPNAQPANTSRTGIPFCGSTAFIGGALLAGGIFVSFRRVKGKPK